jgi:hypothetical protein
MTMRCCLCPAPAVPWEGAPLCAACLDQISRKVREQKPDTTAVSVPLADSYESYAARLAMAHQQRADMAPAPPGTTLH